MLRKKLLEIMLCSAVLAMATGCSVTKNGVKDYNPDTIENSAEVSASNAENLAQNTEQVTNESLVNTSGQQGNEQVENNMSYFVKVGDKIYYRSYPLDSTEESLGAHFMNEVNGKATDIMCYDLNTKESTLLFHDNGRGEIAYVNGRLYLSEVEGGVDDLSFYSYSCLLDGSDVKMIDKSLRISSLFDYDSVSNCFVYISETDTFDYSITLMKNDTLQNVIINEEGMVYPLCVGEGYLVYQKISYEGEPDHLIAINLTDMSSIELGTLPGTCEEGFYDAIVDARIENGTLNFAGERYEGSGSFLASGTIFTADVKMADSLQIDREYTDNEIVQGISPLNRTVSNSYLDGSSFQFEYGEEYDMVEKAEMTGNYAFYVVNHIIYDEDESIGWRDCYKRTATEYIMVDTTTKELVTLSTVE